MLDLLCQVKNLDFFQFANTVIFPLLLFSYCIVYCENVYVQLSTADFRDSVSAVVVTNMPDTHSNTASHLCFTGQRKETGDGLNDLSSLPVLSESRKVAQRLTVFETPAFSQHTGNGCQILKIKERRWLLLSDQAPLQTSELNLYFYFPQRLFAGHSDYVLLGSGSASTAHLNSCFVPSLSHLFHLPSSVSWSPSLLPKISLPISCYVSFILQVSSI